MSARDEWMLQYLAGATLQQIATDAGVHHNTVWRQLIKEGVARRPPGRTSVGDREAWVRLYAEGLSLRQIAARAGCHEWTVLKELEARGIKRRPRGPKRRIPMVPA
jgi:DNA-directed RNA polymerase specialized sigma24 family protein